MATTYGTPPLRIYYSTESQELLTVQKPFIFYGSHDMSRNHRIRGQLMGLTKPTADKLNKTDEAIVQDEPKQVPTSPTRTSGPFNTAIMSRMVTKPVVQTVGSTLKPHY